MAKSSCQDSTNSHQHGPTVPTSPCPRPPDRVTEAVRRRASGELSEQLTGVIILYVVVWLYVVVQVVYYADKVPAGVFPDEVAHASYVLSLSVPGASVFPPRFEDQYLLEPDGGWGNRRSSLGHPPLYYQVVRLLSDRLPSEGTASLEGTVRRFRSVSVPLGITSLSLMLWLGLRLRMPLLCHLVYAVAVASVPMLAFTVAGVNNDVLALTCGALSAWGLMRWQEGRQTTASALLIASGVGLALLVKLTAALLCGVLTAVTCALWLRSRGCRPQHLARLLVPVVTACCPGLVYHGMVWVRYGTLTPFLRSRLEWMAPAHAPGELSLLEWGGRFVHLLGASWVNISAHRVIDRSWPVEAAGPVVLALIAGAGVLLPRRHEGSHLETLRLLMIAAAVTFLGVLSVHFAFTYRNHLLTGVYGGVQARYYFPLLPLLLLGASRAFERVAGKTWPVAAALLLAASLVYADFYTFLREVTIVAW